MPANRDLGVGCCRLALGGVGWVVQPTDSVYCLPPKVAQHLHFFQPKIAKNRWIFAKIETYFFNLRQQS
jgi:hypothetical protein